MSQTAVRSSPEPSVLDLPWPEPLVQPADFARLAPWFVPGAPRLAYASPRLIDIATLITAQENACRYCYGALRAGMRLAGYRDEQIDDLEREVELADEVTREVVLLARKLARSNPRPVREELSRLVRLGLDPRAVAEIVFAVALSCFTNRVGTFLALPLEHRVERIAQTWLGRLFGPLILSATGHRTRRVGPGGPVAATGVFAPLINQLPEAPFAAWFAALADVTFRPGILKQRTKMLILAVVARTLGCRYCEDAARTDLCGGGLTAQGFESIMHTLAGPDLEPGDSRILDWARETVHYETGIIQKRTKALAADVGGEVVLEAVGAAAVSNTAVRLAMLLP
jgi:alkylhydroperoxidase family enzyme